MCGIAWMQLMHERAKKFTSTGRPRRPRMERGGEFNHPSMPTNSGAGRPAARAGRQTPRVAIPAAVTIVRRSGPLSIAIVPPPRFHHRDAFGAIHCGLRRLPVRVTLSGSDPHRCALQGPARGSVAARDQALTPGHPEGAGRLPFPNDQRPRLRSGGTAVDRQEKRLSADRGR